MPAQQEVESSMRGVAIDLRGVGQQNSERIDGNGAGRFFDVIDPIVVRVVDTGQLDGLATPPERFALIEQDANSHVLETGDHANRIVIAQYPINRFPEMGPQSFHAFKRIIKRSKCRAAIVSSNNACVVFQIWEQFFEASHRAFIHIDVEITNMKQGEAIKRTR